MNIWNSYIALRNKNFKQMKDHRSNALNLSSWEKQAWKKFPAWTGLEAMTSAILVQLSCQLSYQANLKLVIC